MLTAQQYHTPPWALWKKIVFRFFFIYLLLFIAPWSWLGIIPGVDFVLNYYFDFIDWAVIKANANFFHVFGVKNVVPVYNGSGDTSFNWATTCFYLSVAMLGCIIWSIIEARKKSYNQLNYLLCLLVRYNLAMAAFTYGFLKIFALQMPFPLISQMATPLGDFLPMRLSWMFIGYSVPYQIFSGIMEVMVGLLLLWRRTATLGVLLATAVFINVMMLNFSYDIPVKLYSMSLVLMCFYLVLNEYNRIACFFVLNKPAPLCSTYSITLTKKWMRITRLVLKLGVLFIVGKGFFGTYQAYKELLTSKEVRPFNSGIYTVTKYILNNDTIPPLITDTLRWQNIIFEKMNMGSVQTNDTIFRKRYGRGYFNFTVDTGKQLLDLKKFAQDTALIASFHYQMHDSNTIVLKGKKLNDSLYLELKKSQRNFQLAEKQFHWLSEANR